MYFKTFLCFSVYRVVMAFLLHFNWLLFMYHECLFFQMWKSYDLLWFWSQLMLCLCFPSLRETNYIVVWCTILRKKCCSSERNKTIKLIYDQMYRKMKKKIRQQRNSLRRSRKRSRPGPETPELDQTDDDDGASSIATVDKKQLQSLLNGDETLTAEADRSTIEIKMTTPNKQENPPDKTRLLKEKLQQGKKILTDKEQRKEQLDRGRQMMVQKLRTELRPTPEQLAETLAAAKNRVAGNAINMGLQVLRLRVSFSILVGHVREKFTKSLSVSKEYSTDTIELLQLIYKFTIFIDIFLFWFAFLWTVYLQYKLYWLLGLKRFLIWLAVLLLIGGIIMELPMYIMQDELDPSWCKLLPRTFTSSDVDLENRF